MSPRFSIRPLATLADRRLAELAAGGDERAFEVLITRHRVPLERYCWRLGLPDHRAEDVLQQAFTRAWVALRSGGDVGQPRAWLYRIVHNAALNAHRSARLRTHESIDAPVLGSLALATTDDVETRLRALDALREVAALPDMQRQAVVMTAIEGRSHEEAAGALGVSDGAVRGLLHRARTKLRAAAAALTPQGLAELLARVSSGGAEAGAGAAGAGLGGLLAKGAAVTAATGLLAGGAVTQLEHSPSHARRTEGASTPRAAAHAAPAAAPALQLDARSEALLGDRHGSPTLRSGREHHGRNTRGGERRDGSSGGDRAEGRRSGGGGGRGETRSGDRAQHTTSSGGDGGRLSQSGSGAFAVSDGRPAGERSGGGGTPGGDGSSGSATSPVLAAATLAPANDGATAADSGGSDGSGGSSGGS